MNPRGSTAAPSFPLITCDQAMNHFTTLQLQAGSGVATTGRRTPRIRNMAISSALAMLLAGAAHAQTAPAGESAMVRLIRGLVQSGALTKDVGDALLAQAQTEALAAQQAQRQAAAAPVGGMRVEPGDVRVPYISETMRDQIRDEIKGQVMAQAKSEGWAAPNETPEWTQRIHIEGDVRVRSESRLFSADNSTIETDWRAINSGSGYDINSNTNLSGPPLLNTRQDRRNLLRARARLGILADVSETVHAGVRLATGNDDSAVSTTQTLGGGLAKKDIWLDQAWISYKPLDNLTVTGGRFGNPFFSTDTLFSGDLNFDGITAQFEKTLASNKNVSVFATGGVIPLEYSSDSFPSNSQSKMSSENKWLIGAQVGANWKLDSENNLRGALAYYNFSNISGQVSESCALYAGAENCSTDWSRPAFMQKGNTLMLLRNIALDPTDSANTAQPQYVGLAAKFQLLDLNMRWDTKVAGGYSLRLDANFIHNLAYDEDDIFARAQGGIVNNMGGAATPTRADFQSGPNAYMFQATFGNPSPSARGDWNVLAGYKRIEPDSMPDGYNDSTFHLGGTNAHGYYLGASYAVAKNAWFSGRWTSSKQIYGAPVAIDTLQVDFNARF